MLEILLYFFKQRVKHHLMHKMSVCALTTCAQHGKGRVKIYWSLPYAAQNISGLCEVGMQGYDHLTAFLRRPPVKDVSVMRWRRTNYVMGTQPVRRAINLGKAEMTGGPGLLTVKAAATSRFHASLTSSRRVLYSGFLSRTLPDFPKDPSHKIISGFVGVKPLKIGQLI